MGIIDSLINSGSALQAQQFARTNYKHRYQWTVEDMRKAGINPIMAASLGGGQGPPAAQASSSGTSVMQALQMRAQTKLLKQQTRKTAAEASIAEGNVPLAGLKGELSTKAIKTGRRFIKKVSVGVERHNATKRESTTARRNYQSGSTSSDGFFLPPLGRIRGGRR